MLDPLPEGLRRGVCPFSNMLGPLPESLRIGVYEAYGNAGYGQFMRRVVALEEGTMSLEVADNDVFAILGYDGGWTDRYHQCPQRDASSKSHRPDLYRMFVEWSPGEQAVVGKKNKNNNVPFSFGVISIPTGPPVTPCLDAHSMPESVSLDSLTNEVLVKDLIALDAALTMSPTMLTALSVGAGGPSVPVSFGAMRLVWQKELLKRVRTGT